MAVPDSGALSLRGIMREVKTNNYNSSNSYFGISLYSLSTGGQGAINTNNPSSNRPDGNAPHLMSEWYSYDHDKIALRTWSGNPNSPASTQICGNSPNTTYYHSGTGTLPTTGDTIYTDSAGTTKAAAGFLAYSTTQGIQINSSGVVSGTYTCDDKKK